VSGEAEISEYLEKALRRIEWLGGQYVVFGSGASRRRPEGMGYTEAFNRLTGITRLCGRVAQAHGITVVIEPLNRSETNLINSVGEGACLAAAVNHERVRLLADYYHIAREKRARGRSRPRGRRLSRAHRRARGPEGAGADRGGLYHPSSARCMKPIIRAGSAWRERRTTSKRTGRSRWRF